MPIIANEVIPGETLWRSTDSRQEEDRKLLRTFFVTFGFSLALLAIALVGIPLVIAQVRADRLAAASTGAMISVIVLTIVSLLGLLIAIRDRNWSYATVVAGVLPAAMLAGIFTAIL